ncbi:polyhydroxyalkanoate granule-associated phasin [Paracidovorax wautersii]|uniref:Uncharacterized protein n=1 Tax=Paracidovorax wautersii TaxID=1177982 RepID=A0ABU1IDI4_9BURK|nr:polyhydroxyalkanoate granule-associated phasin [Paracidovorax wautersii]MDR6215016.1 hypothetical protein [Paracidovorax wautersii]
MSVRRNRKAASVMRQTADLAVAAPQVVAHRVARMAAAGAAGVAPSARDQREFTRMVQEKQVAFGQAWLAMGMQAMVAGPALAMAAARAWYTPWQPGAVWNNALATQWQSAVWGVWAKGLAPVRAKAVANARRLARG